jgi:hypothetical protein
MMLEFTLNDAQMVPRDGPQWHDQGVDLQRVEPPWGVEPQTYALRET